jgi:predicted AAA+ superfamily ATPase
MAEGKQQVARFLQAALEEALSDTPVVCLLGARQTGKSTLAEVLAPDREYISLDDQNYLQAASSDPAGFVAQLPANVTLDEVQRVPELLLAIKRVVDSDRRAGRFLLTGSANLLQRPRLADSLAGRMECLFLQPFAEAEKAGASGQFLRRLLNGELQEPLSGGKALARSTLPDRLLMGGYPEPNQRSPIRARQWHRQYIRSIVERDIRDVARIKDGGDVARLLELLALRTAELLNVTSLAGDLHEDRQTVDRHLAILEKLFLIRALPAWHRNSAKRLVKAPKIHLCDSGLAATLADLRADDWNGKRERFGHLLESFVLQQLVAQAGWTDPDLRFWHYRDKDQVEVDCVITRGNKVWGIEVKAAATVNASDGRGLHRLAEQAKGDFQSGILLYDGDAVLPLGKSGFLAVPLSRMWEW